MSLAGQKFNKTVEAMARGGASTVGLLLNADTIKVALYTAATAPAATDTTYATTLAGGSVEVATANGYTQGGQTCGAGITSNSAGTETLRTTSDPAVLTSNTGNVATRYFVMYDSTCTAPSVGNLLAFWDYGSTLTLAGANGDTLTLTGPITSWATLG